MNTRLLCLLLFAAALVIVLGSRLGGPSDLLEKTQPKTIAYTADMVVNGQWLLPRDHLGEPATKPPLYNWLSAAVIAPTELWREWTLKLPSMIAGLITIVLCVWMTRRMVSRHVTDEPGSTVDSTVAGLVSATLLLAGYTLYKHIYIARPDMLLTALLTAAWVLGTLTLDRAGRGERRPSVFVVALGTWLCVGAAALTKGPVVIVVPIYLLLAAGLIHRRWRLVHATGWWWGLPLALGMFAAWIVPVYLTHPDHVREVLIGAEIVDRVSEGGPLGVVFDVWKMPAYFVTRWLPWSVLVIIALVQIRPGRWFRHALGPAILWMLVVLVFFSVSSGKLPRYLLPLYPAASAIAVWALLAKLDNWRRAAVATCAAACLVIGVLALYHCTMSWEATHRLSENTVAFVDEIRPIVGDDYVAFNVPSNGVLPTLLGRYQGAKRPPKDRFASAPWRVVHYRPDRRGVVAVSEPVWLEPDGRYIRVVLLDRRR